MSERLNIALIGYGAMGQEVKRLTEIYFHQYFVSNIFEIDSKISENGSYNFDVAIDFSHPTEVVNNVAILAHLGKNLVIGTTGWYDRFEEVKSIVEKSNVGVVYGTNFSIGVNIFLKLVEYSARLIDKIEEYDAFIHEIHHKRKVDSPSGTAISIGKVILENIGRKNEILTETSHNKILPNQLHISSTRGGEVPGKHTVYFDSLADTIELTHTARNRSGFAAGALKAAEWVKGKKGLFEFSNIMDSILGN